MKLSKKIRYHAEAAENQNVDGVYVPKSRLYDWTQRAEGYEDKLRDYEALNQSLKDIGDEIEKKTVAVKDAMKRVLARLGNKDETE